MHKTQNRKKPIEQSNRNEFPFGNMYALSARCSEICMPYRLEFTLSKTTACVMKQK